MVGAMSEAVYRTVRGDVPVGAVGPALFHEHVISDASAWNPEPDLRCTDPALVTAELRLAARDGIGLVVDARIVARFCDIGVFVVRHAATSQHHIRSSLRDLVFRLDLPICGVLNQIDRTSSYAYGYQRKYEQYYGARSPAA